MSQFRQKRTSVLLLGLLSLALAGACSRPAGPQRGDDGAQPDQGNIPFRGQPEDASANAGPGTASPVSGEDKNQDKDQKPDGSLPFKDPRSSSLPAGTLLTVRLQDSVTADKSDASGSFAALVDEPVVVGGKTLVPRGTGVAGRVESSRVSQVKRDTGYVRLTLDSIRVGGREVPLQTSSLFARGMVRDVPAPGGSAPPVSVIRLQKGRRLTFRLTETVSLADRPVLSSNN